MKNKINLLITLIIILLMPSCSEDWLDEKQDIKLIVPTTLNDLSLLMNSNQFSYDGRGAVEASCDDIELSLEQFNSLGLEFERQLITWTVDVFPKVGTQVYQDDWAISYSQIQTCNVVLKALDKIEATSSNSELYNRIKGTALYHRSRAFLNIAMTFCNYYEQGTATSVLGVPLKLDEDINEPITRSSLKQTYQRITDDLNLAATLLPQNPISVTHITNAGAYALLARTYLYMNDYSKAYEASQKSLKLYSVLDDYNSFNPSDSGPLLGKSKEAHILIGITPSFDTAGDGYSAITDDLYELYETNDLRKILFFYNVNGKNVWRGAPIGNNLGGTATNEVLLINAECAVRLGERAEALALLNKMLEKRYKSGTFIPLTSNSDLEVLDRILKERRKELLKRGLRFQDLKRFNKDPRYAKNLTRIIGNQVYTLPSNDKRYTLPLPQYIINYNGIEQN